jgi:serine/threonine protein kinase
MEARVTRAATEVGSTASSYEILAKLAEGGMAEIFLARGASTGGVGRYVVLKRVLRERATDPHFLKMFLDEARLAAQLQHPNIAQVYDIGKLGDSYFFTMEYVHGETVRAILQRAAALKKPLPLASVLTIAAGSAAGLSHAHDRIGIDRRPLGIVHRDVSPSNLMVGYEGHVKLVDFGVAKATDRLQETRSGTVKGKISYMSPEQCRGRHVDRRSDLFSLGIVLWEMLTTERLFRKPSDFEIMAAIVEHPVPPPSSRRADVTPEFDAVVAKLLAKDPDDRFQTAEELVATLEDMAAKTSSVLSAASLGRVMRDLFGPRPEPWVEFDEQELSGKAVTVTSEPIPAELSAPRPDEIALQLASVADLRPIRPQATPAAGIATSTSEAGPLPGPPTVRQDAVTGDDDDDAVIPDMDTSRETSPSARSAPRRAPSSPVAIDPTAGFGGSDASAGSAPIRPSTPSIEPFVAAPTAQPQTLRPRPPVALIAGGAIVAIAIAIAVLLIQRSGDDAPAPSAVAAIDEPAIEPAIEPVVPVDAAVETTATVARDAAPAVEPPAPPPDPGTVLTRAMAAKRFTAAVAACSDGAVEITKHVATCAIAACKARDATKAKRWIQGVPAAKRAPIVAACRASKITLEPRRGGATTTQPKPDCSKNPLDCQR